MCWATYGQNNIILLYKLLLHTTPTVRIVGVSQPWHKYKPNVTRKRNERICLQLRSLGIETKSTKSIIFSKRIGRKCLKGVPLGCERGISSPRAVLDRQLPLFFAHTHPDSIEHHLWGIFFNTSKYIFLNSPKFQVIIKRSPTQRENTWQPMREYFAYTNLSYPKIGNLKYLRKLCRRKG